MHAKLAQALNALDIGDISLFDDKGLVVRHVSPKEHAVALFTYLDIAGYLSPDLLEKAITYLSAAKPFSAPTEAIISHLKQVSDTAHRGGTFNVDWFFDHFCNMPYFQVDDVIDLIVFLQQTAFDRQFGVERDKLGSKPWLELHAGEFRDLATNLGIVTPLPPAHDAYCGTGIMGAASSRVGTRIQHFNSLSVNCGEVWALSGNRELSHGLDEDTIMDEVALAVGHPAVFIEKGEGAAKRSFLHGVTETMMVNYLLQKMCMGKKIALIDSKIEENHWRATAAQGAKDIARIVIQQIQDGLITKDNNDAYRFMIIAEQPYAGRMARQIQRAFNAEIQSKNLAPLIQVIVDGIGPGVQEKELSDIGILTRMNSELGSLMAERFNDARLSLKMNNASLTLRDPKIVMFMDRDATYNKLKLQNEEQASATMAHKC